MGSMQISEPDKQGGRKLSKRRLCVRLDMTPMVDIAFLLLIFYMVSTVFAAPQSMQINLPEVGEEQDFPESNLCVLRVDGDNNCWLSEGDKPGSCRKVAWDSLSTELYFANYDNMLLSTLVRIHPEAKFDHYIEILNDFAKIEKMLKKDREYIEAYLVMNIEKLGPEIFRDSTFSYRYTTAEWNPATDEKIIKLALK